MMRVGGLDQDWCCYDNGNDADSEGDSPSLHPSRKSQLPPLSLLSQESLQWPDHTAPRRGPRALLRSHVPRLPSTCPTPFCPQPTFAKTYFFGVITGRSSFISATTRKFLLVYRLTA